MKKLTTSLLVLMTITLFSGCGTFGGHVPKDPYEVKEKEKEKDQDKGSTKTNT